MLLDKWRHSGFNVFFGPRILPRQEKSMETLARYIIRTSFSQERMNYHRETGQVEYWSKDGKETKIFDALEWLAAMCSHVSNQGESRRGGIITDFIAMLRGENEKRQTPTIKSPASLNRN